jgi:aminoglycoside phosphotransferase (APT) family kinase protein
MGAGDPAVDLIPAWTLFGDEGRRRFRAALHASDVVWARSRGFALHQALLIVPYYLQTNPHFAALARRTIAQMLAELAAG